MYETLFSRNGLSLDRLRVLVDVADAGGISRAVGDDATRQSQYSRQLKELGQAFGVELTCRKGRSLKLTPEGERLAALTRQAFAGLVDFSASVGKSPAVYRFGAGESLLQWAVAPVLASIRQSFPRVVFACTNRRTSDIINALLDFSLDYGLIRENAVPAGLGTKPVGSLDYRLFVPKIMLPAKLPKAPQLLLTELPLATLDGDGDYTAGLVSIARIIGQPLNIALTCSTLPQICQAVRGGGFAGVLPILARQELPEAAFMELDLPALRSLRRPLALCWNPRMSAIRKDAERVTMQLAEKLNQKLHAR
jgi:DNA-binding transcriptional LysR family regulator